MFDYHLHTTVSFDGKGTPQEMIAAAKAAGLKEICFTDHMDYAQWITPKNYSYTLEDYKAAYENLTEPDIKIRRGVEYLLAPYNVEQAERELEQYPYDFVIGSVHLVDGEDIYFEPFWKNKTISQVYHRYLGEVLASVLMHDNFDVLGHLTYICKCQGNPTKELMKYEDYADQIDEILRILVQKGKGIEVNTSGVDLCGDFLPDETILRRFKELGGEIVTVGSDAHAPERVGQYVDRACAMLKEIFGHVCTFEKRKPIFHTL